MHQTLQQGKFEDADFKYENNIFKFQPKNTEIGHFGPKFKNFNFLHEILQQANSRVLISNVTMVFQNYCPKQLNKAFFGSKFKNSSFCRKLCNYTIWRAFIKNMAIVFEHSSQIPKYIIFGLNFFFFFFFRFG